MGLGGGATGRDRVLQRGLPRRGVRADASARARVGRGGVGSGAGRVPAPVRRRGGVAPRAPDEVPGAHRRRDPPHGARDRDVLRALRPRRAHGDHRPDEPHVRDDRVDDLPALAAQRDAPRGAADADHPDARRVVPRPAQRPLPAADLGAGAAVRAAAAPAHLPPALRVADGVGLREPAPRARVRQDPVPDAGACLCRAARPPVRPRERSGVRALVAPLAARRARARRAPAGRGRLGGDRRGCRGGDRQGTGRRHGAVTVARRATGTGRSVRVLRAEARCRGIVMRARFRPRRPARGGGGRATARQG